METIDDTIKHDFLMTLIEEYYTQGDDYHVFKSRKNNWHFSYSNDYPLQHGAGEGFMLPDSIVEILVRREINKT